MGSVEKNNCGNTLLKSTVKIYCKNQLWKSIVEINCGNLLWKNDLLTPAIEGLIATEHPVYSTGSAPRYKRVKSAF